MGSPAVSVIMNCLNGEKYLREAVDSVFAQTYRDWEIVFWDNASTDSSAEIAKSYGERVRYFRSEETYPLGKARNLAIQESRGQYLAFLDCDDIWLPRKLEEQIPLFERNPKVGLVFCDTILFNDKGEFGRVYRRKKPPKGMVFRELLANYFLSLETVIVRKEALVSLDEWFDDRLTVAEEKDLFLRLAYRYEVDYVEEPLAKWRDHRASGTHTLYELFPIENELILRKFRQRYERFERDYSEEARALERKITWQRALAEWKAGRSSECRVVLRPYVWENTRTAFAYLLSYLGLWGFERLMPFYFRWRRY